MCGSVVRCSVQQMPHQYSTCTDIYFSSKSGRAGQTASQHVSRLHGCRVVIFPLSACSKRHVRAGMQLRHKTPHQIVCTRSMEAVADVSLNSHLLDLPT